MSLFTSNFKAEAKVILSVVIFIACIEIGVHIFERRMAVGLHTPKAAESLMQGEGHRILILGNSLVRDGVETKIIDDVIKNKSSEPFRIEKSFLVAATASDWYYIFKHSFADSKKLPDTLILCFAYTHLDDYPLQRPYIARYYSSLSDIPQIFTDEVKDFDGRAEFLLFAGSLSFSQRTPLQRRAHDVIIPHHRETALRINKALNDELKKPLQNYQAGHKYLERLIKTAQENNVNVILLAMPAKEPYPISTQVEEIIKNNGVVFWDNRTVKELKNENFNDDSHLNDSGKKAYSLFLSERLFEYLNQK